MADELKRAKAVQEKAAEEEATKKGEFEHALASFKAKVGVWKTLSQSSGNQ